MCFIKDGDGINSEPFVLTEAFVSHVGGSDFMSLLFLRSIMKN